MTYENKTIREYLNKRLLETGGSLYSYALGFLHEYKLMYCVKSEYNDDLYALLKPINYMDCEHKKWQKVCGYENEKDWLRANIKYDTRFSVNPAFCLNAAIQSLQKHIVSSEVQKSKAEKILKNMKS